MKKYIMIVILMAGFIGYATESYAQTSSKRVRSTKQKTKSSAKIKVRKTPRSVKPTAPNPSPTESSVSKPVVSRTKKVQEPKGSRPSYFIFGPKVLFWQESIEATRGADSSELRSQFSGVVLGITYRKPMSNIRWVQTHSLDIGGGALVAKSAGTSFTDHLKNQMWYMVTVRPGLGYRTTSNSELGFGVPITIRRIDWQLKDPALKLDRETSFSYGVGGTYVTQVSRSSSLQVELIQHIPWNAFVWSLGWNYRFH
jgi:hypothetical protein